ncbi:Hypothetical protein SRAE_0000075800 [Strongyloides ratti]|uniref:Uncharacterized protein n=1 Tax=Strongyloides ratti TaxID=34506 RepID=A0A090MTK3_STRRB|nr:Hypothetical protein SRAE_0000075800 [Strongyloides ratti]CEF61643.1 Hypothetical protein SRAE_0000075800 [Strongyloides ratti]
MAKSKHTNGDGMFSSDNFITKCKELGINYVDRNQNLHKLMKVAAYIRHLDNEYSEEIKTRINEKTKVLNVIYKPGDKFIYKKNLEGKFKDLYQEPFIVIKDLGTKVTFKAKNERILTAIKVKIKRFYGSL